MTQPIEIILLRQLATTLALPVWLLDPAGELIFFNEAAERVLGRRFQETEPLHVQQMLSVFNMTLSDGSAIPVTELPLAFQAALRHPLHRELGLTGFDGRVHAIEVTAFPVIGHQGVALGVVAMFWERQR